MRTFRAVALGIVFAAISACSTPGGEAVADRSASPLVAKIDTGEVRGAVDDGVLSFKGIPFAAAPIGELRWRAPQPAAHWQGVREATSYAHDCMQQPFPGDAAPLGTPPAEDCLYLNVWRPAASTKRLPVMVWIYGGGFVNGGASPPTYAGANLARHGIVVVSFNYRLGRFGFFAHPQLTKAGAGGKLDDGLLGNYGYMDQLAALKWVKRNVAAFGGDLDHVTIVGESAGGGSVHTMVTSPLAKGLFARAVVMSGGGRGNLMGEATLASSEPVGVAFAKSKGIAADDPQALVKLRALSAEEVTSGLSMAALAQPAGARTFSTPMVDGKLVVENAQSAYEHDRFQRVPMMIGATSNDIGGRIQAADKDALFAQFGANAAQARAAFDPDGQAELADLSRRVGLLTGSMIEPARYLNGLIGAKGVATYEYRFSYVADSLRTPKTLGAGHASDIPFFFDTVRIKYEGATTAKDEGMGKAMSAYLVNFVKTGDPNGAGLPAWPRYSGSADPIMDFSWDGQPKPQTDPWGKQLDAARTWFEGRR